MKGNINFMSKKSSVAPKKGKAPPWMNNTNEETKKDKPKFKPFKKK